MYVYHAVTISRERTGSKAGGRTTGTAEPNHRRRPTGRQRNGQQETRPEAAFPYIPGNGIHRRPPTTPDCLIYTCEHNYPYLLFPY